MYVKRSARCATRKLREKGHLHDRAIYTAVPLFISLVGLAGGEAGQHGGVQAAGVVETLGHRWGAAHVLATVRGSLRRHFL